MKLVNLSSKTRKLVNQYLPSNVSSDVDDELDVSQVLKLFDEFNKINNLHAQSLLYAALFNDLSDTLKPANKISASKFKNLAKTLWPILTMLAGGILVALDGFTGVSTFFLATMNIPVWIIIGIGICSALLAVLLFYTFDFQEITKNFDVNLTLRPLTVDAQFEEYQAIKKLFQAIENPLEHEELADKLSKRYDILVAAFATYQQKEDASKGLFATQKIVGFTAGFLTFSTGFLLAKEAIPLLVLFMAPSLTISFWPMLAISIGIGMLFFAIYYLKERPRIEELVGRLFGIDSEKNKAFRDDTIVKPSFENLASLFISKQEAKSLTAEIDRLKEVNKELRAENKKLKISSCSIFPQANANLQEPEGSSNTPTSNYSAE